MDEPAQPPRLVFDGDCGFCKRCVLWLQARTGSALAFTPYKDCEDPRLDPAECAQAVHLIERDGEIYRGAEAVVRGYAHVPGLAWVRAIVRIPGFHRVFEPLYRGIARHRTGISRLVRFGSGANPEPSSWFFARRGFVVLLSLALFAAFVSLWGQVDGLFGPDGLVPVDDHTDWQVPTWSAVAETPSLLWLWPSLDAVKLICVAGMTAAGLLLLGLWPRLMILVGFTGYVSLVTVGQGFLDWPWDRLLCEMTFLAWFLVPSGKLPRWRQAPSTVGLWLLRLLLVRVLLVSGLFKLFGSDPAWQSFSVFEYHLWTQPVPSWPGYALYYAGSQSWAKVAAIVMLVIELLAPLALLGPRRLRILGVFAILVLELGLGLCGNDAFQALIIIALSLCCVDDQTLRARLPRRIGRWLPETEFVPNFGAGSLMRLCALVLLVSAGSLLTLERIEGQGLFRGPVASGLRLMQSMHLVDVHLLHTSIRQRRPELVVEGSQDKLTWREIEFRFKPGNPEDRRHPDRLPPWLGLHAPRLDLQMHRAAFEVEGGSELDASWMLALARGILAGTPGIDALMSDRAVLRRPPKYLRVKLYRYRFDLQRNRRGGFWRRELRGTVVPAIKLEDGEVVRAW